jgi:WG containing repeat
MSRQVGARVWMVLASFAAVQVAVAQVEPPRLAERCGGPYNLCGFIDRTTKAEVIPQRYERVFDFAEGLAAVRVKGLYGYIDETDKMVIEPQFSLAGGFYLGRAEVLFGDKAGVINRIGQFVVKPQFARAIPLTEDVILAREGTWQAQHFRGRERLDNLADAFLFSAGGGLYSAKTGWLTTKNFEFAPYGGRRDLIWAKANDGSPGHGLFGLLKADGTWQITPQFSSASRLYRDRAVVQVNDRRTAGQSAPNLNGAIDGTGAMVLPLKAWRLSGWYGNDIGSVRENGKEGFIHTDGRLVGGRMFDKVGYGRFENGMIVLVDGQWRGLSPDGRLGDHPDDGKEFSSCPSGVKLVYQSGKVQVLGPDGKPTVPYLLDFTHNKLDCDGPSAVQLDKFWGFVGTDGKLLFDPPAFETTYSFAAGRAAVKIGGKWGIIDTTGRFVVEAQFDELQQLPNGRYSVTKAGRKFWIDAAGVEQPEPETKPTAANRATFLACDAAGTRIVAGTTTLMAVWGITDASGRELIKPNFRAIHCFQNGVAWVPVDAKRQWCPVGPDGVVRTEPACTTSRYPYIQTHSYPEQFSKDPYESSVLWSRAFLDFGAGRRAEPPKMLPDGGNGGTFSIQR